MLRQITTLLRPAPQIDRIRDAAKVERQYAYWRQRILYASLIGYLSTVLSGWGLGRIADTAGWDPVFVILMASAVVAGLLFVLCWNAVAIEHVEKS